MKIATFLGKNDYLPKRVVDFPRERETLRNKIMEILKDFDEQSYNNNGKPWKSSRILRLNPIFFIFSFCLFSFIFFHFLSFSFMFFHVLPFYFIFFLFLSFSVIFFSFLSCSFFLCHFLHQSVPMKVGPIGY